MTTLTQLAERLYATDSEFYDEIFQLNTANGTSAASDVISYCENDVLSAIGMAVENGSPYDAVCDGIFTEAELVPFVSHSLNGTLPA